MISTRILLKAIRKECLECSEGAPREVAECLAKGCPLYPYRMGLDVLYKEEKKDE